MDHQKILNRIDEIEVFFEAIGLKKTRDLPENWDLDSTTRFEPKKSPFIINYRNEDRVLLHIDVYIASGIHFVMRGDKGVSVYETIKTDYNFQSIYQESSFFKEEYRDWKIEYLI